MLSELTNWLKGRRPEPPGDLGAEVGRSLRVDRGGGPSFRALGRAGAERLVSACARPGRVRASAFDLLVADALITYACEAALDTDTPEVALQALMSVGEAP